jgi:hypothetical protein
MAAMVRLERAAGAVPQDPSTRRVDPSTRRVDPPQPVVAAT